MSASCLNSHNIVCRILSHMCGYFAYSFNWIVKMFTHCKHWMLRTVKLILNEKLKKKRKRNTRSKQPTRRNKVELFDCIHFNGFIYILSHKKRVSINLMLFSTVLLKKIFTSSWFSRIAKKLIKIYYARKKTFFSHWD